MNVSFADLLTLLFIYLKLTHHIDWAWIFVVCPIFIVLLGNFIMKQLFLWAQKRKGLQEKT